MTYSNLESTWTFKEFSHIAWLIHGLDPYLAFFEITPNFFFFYSKLVFDTFYPVYKKTFTEINSNSVFPIEYGLRIKTVLTALWLGRSRLPGQAPKYWWWLIKINTEDTSQRGRFFLLLKWRKTKGLFYLPPIHPTTRKCEIYVLEIIFKFLFH